MLTKEQVKSYQALYKQRFGKELDRNEAYRQGVNLIRLIELVYKPISSENYNRLQAIRQTVPANAF